jgi:hypothetical protein
VWVFAGKEQTSSFHPELMLSNTGIVVVPNEPEKSLPNFIEQVSKNIVLIEAKE